MTVIFLILTATEEEETTKETPAAKKMKYEHKKTFFEECLVSLNLHAIYSN